jgi:hypothetical protein
VRGTLEKGRYALAVDDLVYGIYVVEGVGMSVRIINDCRN